MGTVCLWRKAVDRKFYELCALSELKNALRAGDVSVPGSRQFRDFDEYLIDREAFAGQSAAARTGLSLKWIHMNFSTTRMTSPAARTRPLTHLAQAGKLPDVELTDKV